MALKIDGISPGFLDEITTTCNKYGIVLAIDQFRQMYPGVKIVGYAWDEDTRHYLPVFQTNVN